MADPVKLRLASTSIFALALAAAVPLTLSLRTAFGSRDGFLIGVWVVALALDLYVAWVASYVVELSESCLVVRRLFGAAGSAGFSYSQIQAFRVRPDYTGNISRFEVSIEGKWAVQMHKYQSGFSNGIQFLRRQNPSIPEIVLSKWAI